MSHRILPFLACIPILHIPSILPFARPSPRAPSKAPGGPGPRHSRPQTKGGHWHYDVDLAEKFSGDIWPLCTWRYADEMIDAWFSVHKPWDSWYMYIYMWVCMSYIVIHDSKNLPNGFPYPKKFKLFLLVGFVRTFWGIKWRPPRVREPNQKSLKLRHSMR